MINYFFKNTIQNEFLDVWSKMVKQNIVNLNKNSLFSPDIVHLLLRKKASQTRLSIILYSHFYKIFQHILLIVIMFNIT